MSFYRTLLAALAAIAIASPVFADDDAATSTDNTAAPATQTDTNDSQQATTSTDSKDTDSKNVDMKAVDSKVNLNTASKKELMKVKGINSSKAKEILAYRKKNGNFTSVEDLAKVKGFTKLKPKSIQHIEDQLTVE